MRKNKSLLMGLILLVLAMTSSALAQYDRSESSGDFGLPVNLLSFSAAVGNDACVLIWVTASEMDIIGFNLYRSVTPEATYTQINPALIPAVGMGPELTEYQYVDGDIEVGVCYHYLLSSLALDGREESIGATTAGAPFEPVIAPQYVLKGSFPEPFNSQVSIVFSLSVSGRVSLQLYDLQGRKVATLLDRVMSAGDHREKFEIDDLRSGLYLCRLQGENGFDVFHKMVLIK